MARNVIECPYCDADLRIQTDEDGERFAWCEECESDIPIPKNRRSSGGRSKGKRKSKSTMPWLIGGSIAVIALAAIGVIVLLTMLLTKKDAPVIAKAPAAPIAAPAPAVQPQAVETPAVPPAAVTPEVKPETPAPQSPPVQPAETPKPAVTETPKAEVKPKEVIHGADSLFAVPTSGGGYRPPMGPFGRFAAPSVNWVKVPDDPNKYGFLVRMPALAKETTGKDYTTFRSTHDGTNYVVRVVDLPDGTTVSKLDLEQGRYDIDDNVSTFVPQTFDNHQGYAARLGRGGARYCGVVQIESKLYMFVVTTANSTPFGMPSLFRDDEGVSEFIDSIRFNIDGNPAPNNGGRPPVAQAPKKEFQDFDSIAMLPDRLITMAGKSQVLSTLYRRSRPGVDRPEGQPIRGIVRSTGQLHALPDLKPIRNVTVNWIVEDLQATDKGNLLSIECQQLTDGCAFYLHKHDPDDLTQTTRTRIPDKAYFTLGNRTERLPHFNAPTEMFTVVSSMLKSELHPEIKGIESTHLLRQVHLQRGETKPPIEFDGPILQYRVSPKGTWIVVEVDQSATNGINNSRQTIAPDSGKKRYLAVCDAATFKVVKTVPLPNALTHLEIAFDKPDTALLVLTEAGDTRAKFDTIALKTLHSDGRIDAIPLEPWEEGPPVNFVGNVPFSAVRLPEEQGWMVGPIGPLMNCLRIQIENGRAEVVQDSEPCPKGSLLKLDFTLLPDGQRVLFHEGTVVKLSEFFPGMKRFISFN